MKMYQKFMAAAAMALALASCGAGKQATIADLGGEWVITSADGNTLNAETTPFIGINAADGTVYGSTGCNNLVGTLDKNQKPGTVDFSQLGSTRMMCADMTSERIVMDMLNKAKDINSTASRSCSSPMPKAMSWRCFRNATAR